MPTKGGFIGLLVLAGCGVAAPPRPTDPLTDQEIRLVADTLRSRGLLNETSIVTSLTLRDGEKVVDPNRPGDPRQVQAQLYDRSSGIVHDVALILPGAAVRSTRQRSGLVPPLMSTDFRPGVERLAGDSAWLAALRRRGLSTDDISIELLGPGVLGLAWEQPGHRYGRFLPTLRHQEGMTAQPVEGIVGVVDLTEGEVPHLGQTPVQFAVLGQYPPGRVFEIGGRLGDEIPNGGGGKLVDRNVEALRGLTELTLGVVVG